MQNSESSQRLTAEGHKILVGTLAYLKSSPSVANFSKASGVDNTLFSHWRSGRRIPTFSQAYRISIVSGIALKSLRPDVDWRYIDLAQVKVEAMRNPNFQKFLSERTEHVEVKIERDEEDRPYVR